MDGRSRSSVVSRLALPLDASTVSRVILLVNLQIIGFGCLRLPLPVEVSRCGTLWAMSISDMETSTPRPENSFTHNSAVSCADSLSEKSGTPTIYKVILVTVVGYLVDSFVNYVDR